MKRYELTFGVWKHGSGWQPHNYCNYYTVADTPEEAADEWARYMLAMDASDATNFVEMTVWDAESGEIVLTRRYKLAV